MCLIKVLVWICLKNFLRSPALDARSAVCTRYFALLRQAQHETAHSIPNCGIIVTNDLVEEYERDNIHPAKKKEVGDRLALLALNRDYGFS